MNTACFLISAFLSIKFLVVSCAQQTQPDSYAGGKPSAQVNEQNFTDLVTSNLHLNQQIPALPPSGCMRIATFNINALRNFYTKRSTLQDVLKDVKGMHADVYFFQEVDLIAGRQAFESALKGLGYTWQHVQGAPGAALGQMIASKHPLNSLGSLDLGGKRIMIDAELDLKNNDKLALLTAHWDHKDPLVREKQADMTIDYIVKKGGKSTGKFVFGADFNATWQGKSIQKLASSGLMTNSFDALKWPRPNVTGMTGRAVDFLWAGDDCSNHVVGAYVYYTLSSDHLPLIMDLSLEPAKKAAINVQVATQQYQPESYSATQQVSRANFEAFEKGNLKLNANIPSAPINGLRIVTYNLHFFHDLYGKESNVMDVLDDVAAMNAGVMAFQEVLPDTSDSDRAAFDAGLDAQGYKWRYFANGTGAVLGNMIASKYPLAKLKAIDLGYSRVMLEAAIPLADGDEITLFTTHWQNADQAARNAQSRMTVDYLNKKGGSKMGKFILSADCNTDSTSDAVKGLLSTGYMNISFSQLGWYRPRYTCWAGNAIDYHFVGNAARNHVIGSYVFHTQSSDHLPVIVDLDLQPVINH